MKRTIEKNVIWGHAYTTKHSQSDDRPPDCGLRQGNLREADAQEPEYYRGRLHIHCRQRIRKPRDASVPVEQRQAGHRQVLPDCGGSGIRDERGEPPDERGIDIPVLHARRLGHEGAAPEDMPLKGDTVIGNDVWIGQNATILPGVHIGDGAIIGASSVVGSDVEPYTIVAGNPAQFIRNRFDDELTNLMLEWRWWDKPIEEINSLIPILTSSDLPEVKKKIKEMLGKG
jgi:Acetyltransferase (isoleucine patch superfamily)